jgi:hypothetical protein
VNANSGLPPIRFRYLPDDAQAAALFRQGQLASLYLQTPLLKSLVPDQVDGRKAAYAIETRSFDRVRILIINEDRLRKRGLLPAEIKTLRDALDTAIDRKRLQAISGGIAVGDARVLPVFGEKVRQSPLQKDIDALPPLELTIITEPDSFSDQIGAALPKKVGRIKLSYTTVEKGILINSVVAKNYDVVSIVLEATMHAPKFWTAFFDPDGAYVVFGKPIPTVESIDMSSPSSVNDLDAALAADSNWISLLREQRVQAVQPWLKDLRYTPAGQEDLGAIRLSKRE